MRRIFVSHAYADKDLADDFVSNLCRTQLSVELAGSSVLASWHNSRQLDPSQWAGRRFDSPLGLHKASAEVRASARSGHRAYSDSGVVRPRRR